jgi:SAM-dependent methyltransferase
MFKRKRIVTILKPDIQITRKKDLYYIQDNNNRLIRFKPWLGDSFSFLYDFFMNKSIFPKKFGGDIDKHYHILALELADTHGKNVLELATGSGSAVHFLNNDNKYIGTDISAGLLRQAVKRFRQSGFQDPEFYLVSSDNLPFADGIFDLCLCILSLNFFSNVKNALKEAQRVLIPEGILICSVPVPEKNIIQSTIRGTLHSESELKKICKNCGFFYEPIAVENGVLLYFKAIKKSFI